MIEQIAKIIEVAVGDSFTGADYDSGWQAVGQDAAQTARYCPSCNPGTYMLPS